MGENILVVEDMLHYLNGVLIYIYIDIDITSYVCENILVFEEMLHYLNGVLIYIYICVQ